MHINKYLTKKYDLRNYNCWDFVRDVWVDLTGKDIGSRTPEKLTLKNLKEAFESQKTLFTRLPSPENPCMILFERKNILPHVGIFFENRVLHMRRNQNPRYENFKIAFLGFTSAEYYV